MSFLAGTLSGALVASGVYYAIFLRDLQTRTVRHQQDLHSLVNKLQVPQVSAPPPAVARLHHNQTQALLKQRWNEEVEGLFHTVRNWNGKLVEWGRRLIDEKSGSQ